MTKDQNNFAFIDSQNVQLAIRGIGWEVDWSRFRIYLREKYSVQRAYLFIGYIEGNNALYTKLQSAGFICIFKSTLKYRDGTTKGNCDAELVLQAMIDLHTYEQAIVVTGDGDFYCLVKYLIDQKKLNCVLIPNRLKYSALLKRFGKKHLAFMNDLRLKLELKKGPR